MSIHQTAYYVGVILAGWLAGKIADTLGWQYSFILFGAAGVLWGIIMIIRLKDFSAGDCRQVESCGQHSPEGVKVSAARNSAPDGTKPAFG